MTGHSDPLYLQQAVSGIEYHIVKYNTSKLALSGTQRDHEAISLEEIIMGNWREQPPRG